jgi:nickel-dependent lactate racemase
VTPPAWVFSGTRRVELDGVDHFEPPPRHAPPMPVDRALDGALADSIASPPLADLARDCRRVAIAIPDASRPCPSDRILPPVLAALNAVGVADGQVTVLVGCGLHRRTTAAEKRTLAGADVCARATVIDAQGLEQQSVDLGVTSLGAPVLLNRAIADADLTITIGVVEPHLYAGFSGGVKGVAIGCAGEPTIAWTHRPAFISGRGVALGALHRNPFQQTLQEIAARTKLAYAVNVVMDDEDQPVAIAAGDPVKVQASLAHAHRRAWLRAVDGRFDLVVAGIHAPKDDNFYQASRAATYLGLADAPAVAEGGLILICADLPMGAGDGPGEENFAAVLTGADPAALIARGLREPLGPGGQRAFVMARVLERFRVGVLGAHTPEALAPLDVRTYESYADALAAEARRLGRRPRVLAVADAMLTVVHAG